MADEARGDVERGEGKALSLGDQADRVRLAFYQEFNRDADYWTEYVEVYGDFLIAESMERYYRVDYQMAAEGITFTPREQWVEVEKDWTPIGQGGDAAAVNGAPMKASDTMVAWGDAVKALGDGRVGGYLVRFSSEADPDLTGEWFTRATYYGPRDGDGADTLVHHGFPLKAGLEELADRLLSPLKTTKDEIGIFAEVVLDMADEYEKAIYELVEQGKLGWSSGAPGHMVRRKDSGEITRWPIAEGSLTPTPAEPRNRVVSLKMSVTPLTTGRESVTPLTPGETKAEGVEAEARAAGPRIEVVDNQEEREMGEDVKGLQTRLDGFEAKMEDLGNAVSQVLAFMQESPAIRKAGYVTEDGGTADPKVKSFGDYLLAVARKDVTRLASVYKSVEVKDLAEGTGAQGGFLVPTEYSSALLQVAATDSQIVSRVRRIPVQVESGAFPSLDQYTAPTAGAGNTAYAGGVTSAVAAEGATLTETQATFKQLNWRVHKVGGYTEVSNELIKDSPVSIEALLTALFRVAIAAKNERNIIRGTGVGEPLGILNSSATVGVTTATNDVFAYADALAMLARFKSVGGAPVWIIHPSVWPDIGKFEVSTGSGGVWQANLAAGQPQTLLGYPIIVSEHMPQANGDDVILADLSAYLWFDREALTVAFSEHAAFTADKGTWRFTQRVDGMPWLVAPITLADPTGSYTVSTFVYHDD